MQGTACPKREIKNSDTGLENLSTSKRKGKFSELPEKKSLSPTKLQESDWHQIF